MCNTHHLTLVITLVFLHKSLKSIKVQTTVPPPSIPWADLWKLSRTGYVLSAVAMNNQVTSSFLRWPNTGNLRCCASDRTLGTSDVVPVTEHWEPPVLCRWPNTANLRCCASDQILQTSGVVPVTKHWEPPMLCWWPNTANLRCCAGDRTLRTSDVVHNQPRGVRLREVRGRLRWWILHIHKIINY